MLSEDFFFCFPAPGMTQVWLHRRGEICRNSKRLADSAGRPTQKECCGMKAVSFSQSKDSMFGDMTAAPTPRAITIKAILFRHPWPRETLFSIALAYLSASLYIDWRPSSSSLANAFSFYRRTPYAKNNKDGQLLDEFFQSIELGFAQE